MGDYLGQDEQRAVVQRRIGDIEAGRGYRSPEPYDDLTLHLSVVLDRVDFMRSSLGAADEKLEPLRRYARECAEMMAKAGMLPEETLFGGPLAVGEHGPNCLCREVCYPGAKPGDPNESAAVKALGHVLDLAGYRGAVLAGVTPKAHAIKVAKRVLADREHEARLLRNALEAIDG